MDLRYMLSVPENTVVELKIRATVREIEELRDQLSQKYPSWRFSGLLTAAISDARKVWYAEERKVE